MTLGCRYLLGSAVVWMVLAPVVTRAAQAPRPLSRRPVVATQARQPVLAQTAHISGLAITMDDPPKPVTGLKVRLRHQTGRVVATTDLNAKGEFDFEVPEPGTYYVELLDRAGRVVAVEDVGESTVTVAAGRLSTTILRMPARLAGGLWGPGAWAVVGAAAGGGIGAVAATGPPASPER